MPNNKAFNMSSGFRGDCTADLSFLHIFRQQRGSIFPLSALTNPSRETATRGRRKSRRWPDGSACEEQRSSELVAPGGINGPRSWRLWKDIPPLGWREASRLWSSGSDFYSSQDRGVVEPPHGCFLPPGWFGWELMGQLWHSHGSKHVGGRNGFGWPPFVKNTHLFPA